MLYAPVQLQRYPIMERQDLTQSQLGSFKFTPVDHESLMPLVSDLNWRALMKEACHQQQQDKPARRGRVDDVSPPPDCAHYDSKWQNLLRPQMKSPGCLQSAGSLEQGPASSTTISRLVSDLDGGQTSVRPAAQIETPEASKSDLRSRISNRSHSSRHINSSSDMNPIASPFVPTAPVRPVSSDFDGISVSAQTMFSVLATEQESHRRTKGHLEDVLTSLANAEKENDEMRQQIKSLIQTVNMLGSIIKYCQDFPKADGIAVNSSTTPPESQPKLEHGQKQMMWQTIHEILDAEMSDFQHSDRVNSKTVAETAIFKDLVLQTQSTALHHPDVFKVNTSPNSATAMPHGEISGYYPSLHDSGYGQQDLVTIDAVKKPRDVIPHSIHNDQMRTEVIQMQVASLTEVAGDSFTPTIRYEDSNLVASKSYDDTEPARTEVKQDLCCSPPVDKLAEIPTLSLPSSFLAKYRPRSGKVKSTISPMMNTMASYSDTSLDSTDLDHNKEARISLVSTLALPAVAQATHRIDSHPRKIPTKNAEEHPLGLARHAETTASSLCTSSRVIPLIEPMKLNIKWKVTSENLVFEDDIEKIGSLGIQNLRCNQESQFWKYPVRYIEYVEKNLFRTVMVDYIPLGSSYKDILENVCGGAIEMITLHGPIGKAANFMTARIVFHEEIAANLMTSYARSHQIKIRGRVVRVWQVITQTYPKNAQLERDVFENMYTRLLLINLEHATADEVAQDEMRALILVKLNWLKESIVRIGKTVDEFDLIEFTSVKAATDAMNQLRTDVDFRGIEMDFEDDTCAEPYPLGG